MSFHVGQKVVCVDASPPRGFCPELQKARLEKGAIYTIRGFDPECPPLWIGVYLLEVPDAEIAPPCRTPCGWDARRFRPIVSRSTDAGMAILRRILDDHKIKAPKKMAET